jgi:hypothetical protein
MGFLSRLLVPRGVRRAAQPLRTTRRALIPRSVKRARGALHPIRNATYRAERSLNTKRRPRRRQPVWHHGTCTVNHRTQAAADRCRGTS